MKIGIIIGRIGDVDGVGLETEKWIEVLRRLGHEIQILAGIFRSDVLAPERQTHLPILSFFSPECEWEQNRAFFNTPDDPDELLVTLNNNAHRLSSLVNSQLGEDMIGLEKRLEQLEREERVRTTHKRNGKWVTC